jgi:hypothetical protein
MRTCIRPPDLIPDSRIIVRLTWEKTFCLQ